MGSLGSFGQEHAPVEDTFDYFGVELRANPDLSDVMVVDLFGRLAESPEAVRQITSTLVHPDDAEEFWRLVRANRQSMEDLATLAMGIVAALTERPTKRPSVSSDGPSPTEARSEGGSSLRVLEGRPDLQVAVDRAQEARAAG